MVIVVYRACANELRAAYIIFKGASIDNKCMYLWRKAIIISATPVLARPCAIPIMRVHYRLVYIYMVTRLVVRCHASTVLPFTRTPSRVHPPTSMSEILVQALVYETSTIHPVTVVSVSRAAFTP